MESLRFSDDIKIGERIRQEYAMRLHNGIDAELISDRVAAEYFTFPMAAGVYSRGIGAQIDPYRLLMGHFPSVKRNAGFENTSVCGITEERNGNVRLDCDKKRRVNSKYVIVAAGLEPRILRRNDRTLTVWEALPSRLASFRDGGALPDIQRVTRQILSYGHFDKPDYYGKTSVHPFLKTAMYAYADLPLSM